MRFTRKAKNHVHLENIALTDMILNLFLFFVISFGLTTSMAAKHRESPLKVSLPSVGTGSNEKIALRHEIRLLKQGEILWDGSSLGLQDLKEKLTQKENRLGQIALRADKNASVQALVSVLETIRASGATNVSLQTELKTEKT